VKPEFLLSFASQELWGEGRRLPRKLADLRSGSARVSTEVRPAVPRQRARRHRDQQALDEGASPAVVAAWIAEAEQQRDAALASL